MSIALLSFNLLEKTIQIKRLELIKKGTDRSIGVYSHMGGKIVAVTELLGGAGQEVLARDIAMHVAAEDPQYLSPEEVTEEIKEREKDIARNQIKGKPEAIVEKILEGKLKSFYEQFCLLNQKYIKDTLSNGSCLFRKRSQKSKNGSLHQVASRSVNCMQTLKRVVLKLSGQALAGSQDSGIDHTACLSIAESIRDLHQLGLQVGVVVGGGNIFRGRQATEFGLDQTPADHIGMLATMINGLTLQQSLKAVGIDSQVMSGINCTLVVKSYNWTEAMHAIEKRVLIFVGGTSNPYFTTDTAASLRASEIGAQILLKATHVNGIYDEDPEKNPQAKKFDVLSFTDVLRLDLGIMDRTAFALCQENNIPIFVFDLSQKETFINLVKEI